MSARNAVDPELRNPRGCGKRQKKGHRVSLFHGVEISGLGIEESDQATFRIRDIIHIDRTAGQYRIQGVF